MKIIFCKIRITNTLPPPKEMLNLPMYIKSAGFLEWFRNLCVLTIRTKTNNSENKKKLNYDK